MKFILCHSLENEIQHALKMLAKLSWFTQNGYKIKLPEGINQDYKKEAVEEVVAYEFQEADRLFQKIKPEIEQTLNKNQITIKNFFSFFNYDIPDKVIVCFTIYGPGGSYSVPDKIIVMLKDDPEWILKMIIHETIHIIIEEPFIKKFGISHWEKEFIVDGLCSTPILKKLYSNYNPQKQTKKPNLKVIKKLKFKKDPSHLLMRGG